MDEEYSYVYENDSDNDSESAELYATNDTSFSTNDITAEAIKRKGSILSQESEFEIDDGLFSDEDADDSYMEGVLAIPITSKERKELSKGGVPDLKYDCLTTQDIFDNMLKKVHHLQPIFSIPPEDILILLQHYDWNEERLLEVWTERMDDLLVEIGLNPNNTLKEYNTTGSINKTNTIIDITSERGLNFKNNFDCMICCEEKSTEVYSLECGHEYCIECYRHYIENKLHGGNIISCMGCSLALKNEDIDKIMGHASSTKLMLSSIKSFVQKHNRNYKWCPFADCNCIIHMKDTSSLAEYSRLHYSPFVRCSSFHRFCFTCGFEIHAPADCNITNAWIKKARKESENLNWVLSHTKECPKCSVNIEKDGGCNHMVCSSCKYEFCWICEGDWAPHGKSFYQCTLYKNEDGKNGQNSNEDMARTMKKYTFYYRMFNEHEVSAKLDWKLGQTVGNKVKALQEKVGVSWIEGQFLTDSIRTLNEGRTALKWSFPVAFYSDASHNLTKIFVDNQSLLSKAVEDLSELLQIKDSETIMKKKTEFYNKAGYVENRIYALMECGRDLLCKGICKPN